ncbi:MAG: ABC transporter permease [Acidobacteria bacterium]|nr:ABC transporter permease [Acidobacteriota bacterium]
MNTSTIDIGYMALAAGYLLLIIPILLILYYRVKLLKNLLVSILRMTVQLLLVGFYLQFIFQLNLWWLNLLWLLVMVVAADLSIIHSAGVTVQKFIFPLFVAVLAGTAIPLAFFLCVILQLPYLFEAQYFIPIAGMIMGNCLRASIIGLSDFFHSIHKEEKAYQLLLAQGASLQEAVLPYIRRAYQAALNPTIASMATIGLVALPGMMTGIIMGGASPMTAIKYQIAIMIAIFVGTALTVLLSIRLSRPGSFTAYGTLDPAIFAEKPA